MKLETDIIASITASLVGRTKIPVIIYLETFKTNVFIGVSLTIIFNTMGSLLKLKILHREIKGKMDELLIKVHCQNKT